ncbi:MAG TPA: class I SAM-dependent methyltransferase [Acidimicrobiales bacterium]
MRNGRRHPTGWHPRRSRLAPWAWIGVAILLLANGARLRGRLGRLGRLVPSSEPVAPSYHFLVGEGVTLDEGTRRAASAHARSEGVAVLDLVPEDLTVERTLDLARMVDPGAARHEPLATGRSAGHATLVDDDVMRRVSSGPLADVDLTAPLDPATYVRVAETLKRYAARSSALVVAPGLSAVPDDPARRRHAIHAMYGDAFGLNFAAPVAVLVALAAGLVLAPWAGLVALAAFCIQPLVALARVPVRSADRGWIPALRWAMWPYRLMRTIVGEWPRSEGRDLVEERRPLYAELIAAGEGQFWEARRPDCPFCRSKRIAPRVRCSDLLRHKPGSFVLDQCGACGLIFQNPRLSSSGLDYYYRDFYDGLGEGQVASVFDFGDATYLDRAEMVRSVATPGRWLDVGTGHGHFCLVASTLLPDTRFDGLDIGESVEEAERRRWISTGHRGTFPELASSLADRYDVVSMHHYLEHTVDPRAELDSAAQVLAPGGHLLIELPDPESFWGRVLGRYWLPWFQPQHLHLMSIGILEQALTERGFTIVARVRAEASQSSDLTAAVWMLIGRCAPPTNLPWLPRPTALGRARRGLGLALGALPLAGALGIDALLAWLPSRPGQSNAYRLLARRSSAAESNGKGHR